MIMQKQKSPRIQNEKDANEGIPDLNKDYIRRRVLCLRQSNGPSRVN